MPKSMRPNSLELDFLNFISYFIKEFLGKGPRDTKITISDNMLIYVVKGILTPIEKKALESPEGKSVVLQLRKLFVNNTKYHRIPGFEKIAGSKVIEHYEGWNLEEDSAVGVIIFEKNL